MSSQFEEDSNSVLGSRSFIKVECLQLLKGCRLSPIQDTRNPGSSKTCCVPLLWSQDSPIQMQVGMALHCLPANVCCQSHHRWSKSDRTSAFMSLRPCSSPDTNSPWARALVALTKGLQVGWPDDSVAASEEQMGILCSHWALLLTHPASSLGRPHC